MPELPQSFDKIQIGRVGRGEDDLDIQASGPFQNGSTRIRGVNSDAEGQLDLW